MTPSGIAAKWDHRSAGSWSTELADDFAAQPIEGHGAIDGRLRKYPGG
jgi:hypothetical protein